MFLKNYFLQFFQFSLHIWSFTLVLKLYELSIFLTKIISLINDYFFNYINIVFDKLFP